jgi:hypothetical protein
LLNSVSNGRFFGLLLLNTQLLDSLGEGVDVEISVVLPLVRGSRGGGTWLLRARSLLGSRSRSIVKEVGLCSYVNS